MQKTLCMAAILLLAACQDEPVAPETLAETPAVPDVPVTGDAPVAAPVGGARQVVEETDTFLFEYSYPQQAGEQPELAAWLDLQLNDKRDSLAVEALEGLEVARETGFPFNKYSSGTAWEVVADLPDWLSLSATLSFYTGGAHPNYAFDTLVWDKAKGELIEPIAFFTSATALDRALGDKLCADLNIEREKRRGSPVTEGSDDFFEACVKVDETNLLLGSSNGKTFDRIGIQIAPYLAGPYAEGDYEFTFPMTAELMKTVRPEYRTAFAARN